MSMLTISNQPSHMLFFFVFLFFVRPFLEEQIKKLFFGKAKFQQFAAFCWQNFKSTEKRLLLQGRLNFLHKISLAKQIDSVSFILNISV